MPQVRPTIPTVKLRNWIPAGLALCVLTLVLSSFRYADLPKNLLGHPRYLALLSVALLSYGYAAFHTTGLKTRQDLMVLRYGTIWGLAIGCTWTIEVVFANIVIPHWLGAGIGLPAGIVALLLPVIAGAVGGIKGGRVWIGMRVGFWSGAISGIIAFLVIAAVGYILALVPGLPGAEVPTGGLVYTGADLEQFRVLDALAAAVNHLLPIGAVYCSFAGAFGAVAGILLERTGRSTVPQEFR